MSLREKSGKSGHISGPSAKTRDDRTTLTLHTDRALIGDVLGALKQVLGRSGSRAMAKNQYFATMSWRKNRANQGTYWDLGRKPHEIQ